MPVSEQGGCGTCPQVQVVDNVMAKILLVEDDYAAGEMLQSWLEHLQHSVELVRRGDEAEDRLKLYSYDLVLLDWNLPGKSGIEVCRGFRAGGGQTPVLMLTSKNSVDDKAEGLYGGADDYLSKPYDIKELAARITALLRRAPAFKPSRLQVGEITFDAVEHQVLINNEIVHLLPKEFALLELFLKHPNQLLSTELLLNKVWSSESDTTASVVKAHIYNLRKKISRAASPVINTVHGLGYRLDTGKKSESAD